MNVKTRFFVNLCEIRLKVISVALAFFCAISLGSAANGQVYFQDDFEDGTIDATPNPDWSWKPIEGIALGPMAVGERDIYSISDDRAFSGDNSWRLDFAGRNDWGNQCGTKTVTVTQSDIDSGSVAVTGAPWNDALFNKTNGFSKWEITSSTNSEVFFDTTTALGDSLTTANGFSAGDELKIPYKCGVNGIVGGNVNKRNDVNKAINYLDGIESADFDFGESISRSFYLYIPEETILPNTTLKLGYFRAKRNENSPQQNNYTLKLSVQRGISLELSTPGGVFVDTSYTIDKNQWQYFEETWTRESANGLSDGKYVLRVRKENESSTTTAVVQDNVLVGSLVRMSVNGNFQNVNDASGFVYFDDFLISSPVPEPTSATLGFLAAIGFFARRRRPRCRSK